MSSAITRTASAQIPDTTALLFSSPSDTLARIKVTAVSGTICGCPGRMLCRIGTSNVQPSSTRLEITTPKPLTTFGMNTKLCLKSL